MAATSNTPNGNGKDQHQEAAFDALVIGAGFAGMYMLHRLRRLGLATRVIEAGSGVGGTWYWNRYPGARCDVESVQYSYQFDSELEQEWEWTEHYATQPEILRYADHVADRLDLRRDMDFNTRVTAAHFDDARGTWTVETETGRRYTAPICIMATGCLSAPNTPKFDGIDSFRGATYHTGLWPHESVDFTGLRVGIIGTGSSAIQSIPLIAEQAKQLTVFQRTPHYSVPARNRLLKHAAKDEEIGEAVPCGYDPDVTVEQIKAHYPAFRARAKELAPCLNYDFRTGSALEATSEARWQEYEARWQRGGVPFLGAFGDLLTNEQANDTAAEFVREKIRRIVDDPEVAEKLCPTGVIGCKRLVVDTDYFATYNRENVSLVDVSNAPIERLTPKGIQTAEREYPFDAIVFATGFDAMTGALKRIDIRGSKGVSLTERWAEGPKTYLGLMVAGFPNMFTITGPGSPSVLSNMIPSIEQHVDWIAACIEDMRAEGHTRIEATDAAQDDWVAHNRDVAGQSLRSTCSSWYVGANVPGKPRVFMPYIGGYPAYVQKCEEVVANGYEGFALS